MAKLSARGRIELLRLSKEEDLPNVVAGVVWRRWTRAYMSDGNILEKYDVRTTEKFHSYGWKRKMKQIKGLSLQTIAKDYEKNGWVIEHIQTQETVGDVCI
jgi:hypothetical protein